MKIKEKKKLKLKFNLSLKKEDLNTLYSMAKYFIINANKEDKRNIFSLKLEQAIDNFNKDKPEIPD